MMPLKRQVAVLTLKDREEYNFLFSVDLDNAIAEIKEEDYLPQKIYVVMVYERGKSEFFHSF